MGRTTKMIISHKHRQRSCVNGAKVWIPRQHRTIAKPCTLGVSQHLQRPSVSLRRSRWSGVTRSSLRSAEDFLGKLECRFFSSEEVNGSLRFESTHSVHQKGRHGTFMHNRLPLAPFLSPQFLQLLRNLLP